MGLATLFRRSTISHAGAVGSDTELFELSYSDTSKVDRNAGIIRGVKVLGGKSENGREYTNDAMIGAVGLYEGVRVYVSHKPQGNRDLDEWVGVLRGVRYEHGGIFADMHLRKEGSRFAELCEAAESFPHSFGLSHHAVGDLVKRDGKIYVERIKKVHSVDFVPRPACNQTLFESGQTMKKTLAAIAAEHKSSHTEWATLLESIDGAATIEVEFADGATADQQLTEAVGATVVGLLESAKDFAGAKASLAKLFGLSASPPAKGAGSSATAGGPGAGSDGGATGDAKALLESVTTLTATVAKLQKDQTVSRVLESHGLSRAAIGAERVTLLESLADEAAMNATIKAWPPAARGIRAPQGGAVSLLESAQAIPQLKSPGDVRAILRGR